LALKPPPLAPNPLTLYPPPLALKPPPPARSAPPLALNPPPPARSAPPLALNPPPLALNPLAGRPEAPLPVPIPHHGSVAAPTHDESPAAERDPLPADCEFTQLAPHLESPVLLLLPVLPRDRRGRHPRRKVIQGTFGVIQGTFDVIQGTFGVIQVNVNVTYQTLCGGSSPVEDSFCFLALMMPTKS
jgi:hypothetical protein